MFTFPRASVARRYTTPGKSLLVAAVSLVIPLFGPNVQAQDITVAGPIISTPVHVKAHNIGCYGSAPLYFGYSVDNGSQMQPGSTPYDIDTLDSSIKTGSHTIHFKSWTASGECPQVDTTFTVGAPAAPIVATPFPETATSSGDLEGSAKWEWNHDPGTPGSSRGSSVYPQASPSLDGTARQYYFTYAKQGGEIYHLTFGSDTNATHFVYDTYVFFPDTSQVENVEMDMNQVMSDGRTVIFGTQCATGSGTWEYTKVSGGQPHWYPSNIPCKPSDWSVNAWHHVQIASHRDDAGVVTYDWVIVDGVKSVFQGAVGPSALGLGWPFGDLLLNFQLDGKNGTTGAITAYTDKMTIYRW